MADENETLAHKMTSAEIGDRAVFDVNGGMHPAFRASCADRERAVAVQWYPGPKYPPDGAAVRSITDPRERATAAAIGAGTRDLSEQSVMATMETLGGSVPSQFRSEPVFPPPGSRVETVNDVIVLAQSVIAELCVERDRAIASERRSEEKMRQSVPFIVGGRYAADDGERWACRLIWWPNELPPPFFNGEQGSRTIAPWSTPLPAATEAGSHDYHGPLGADRRPTPDPVHEQFHRAVGDALAGRVLPDACRQMQEALKQRPKDAPAAPRALTGGNKAEVGLVWRP